MSSSNYTGRPEWPRTIDQTCCGKCPGATCYVDYLTGERDE
jgi:hypothetical protein